MDILLKIAKIIRKDIYIFFSESPNFKIPRLSDVRKELNAERSKYDEMQKKNQIYNKNEKNCKKLSFDE